MAASRLTLVTLVTSLATTGFMAYNALIGLIARALGLAEWQVGAIVSVAGVAWLLSSPVWGVMSDRLGRVRIIRGGLVGYTVGFALTAAFLWWALPAPGEPPRIGAPLAFAAMLALRAAVAMSHGATTAASQALVADITTAADRARGMAAFGIGQSLGMVFGPGLAALASVWSLTAPIVASVALGVIALLFLVHRLGGASAAPTPKVAPLRWTDPRIRFPMMAAFCAMSCVMCAHIVTGFFAQDRFTLSNERAASVAGMALTAVGFALVSAAMLVRRFGWSPRAMMLAAAPVAAIGFGSAVWISTPAQMVAAYFVSGFGMGFIFPAFQAANSRAVGPHEQGAAAGRLGAAQALGMVVAPLIATGLYRSVGENAPYLMASALLGVVFLLAWREPAGR